MSFLAPWNLLWMGLLVPLVGLYILKRRRQERVIASTLLWEQALRDLRAERPWQRLIPQVALLLQALVIVLGALALARPVGAGSVPRGARVAVVVDVSASMAATHEGTSRLDRARALAMDLARALPPGGEMMVVQAGAEPSVLLPFSSDPVALDRSADGLAIRGARGDLAAAVALCSERMRGAPSGSRILVFTDRASDGELALDGTSVPVDVRDLSGSAGASHTNTGIVDADVRARAGERSDRADVFVRVAHFGEQPVDLFVTASVDGSDALLASRRVTIAAGSAESVVMPVELPPDASGQAPLVRVAIASANASANEGAEGMGDALNLDDVAVVASPGSRRVPVFLVGAAAPPVERVMRADENVELFTTTLDALGERDDPDAPLDGLVVYSGAVPERPPPGDSLVIAPAGDTVFEVSLGDEASAPTIVTWDDADPRLRFVSLRDVHLVQSRTLRGGAARALVTADVGPVIGAIARPDGETTVIAFDPMRSDWPRDPSFVVFFRNLLERARDRRAAGGIAQGALGEPLRVPAPAGSAVVVETPSGDRLTADSRGGLAIVSVPAEPGVYTATVGDRTFRAMRNLLDAEESDVSPRLRITRGGTTQTAALLEPARHTESWPWLALAVLAMLLAEVLWSTRRAADPTRRKKTPEPKVAR